ncbi:rhomboid-like protein 20 [Zingiber officinale]|uniref:rhomboid-like protein 20 n=1 Tax=Zingiber officinale TaxID=94328 RepID=UPI001C4DC29A|nr:rhomboid-like protein 20 [Zingiber officinale]
MMHGGPSGFHNAPVTRTLVISSAIITVTSALRGRSRSIGLSYQDIIQNYSLWKIVPSIFAFSSSPESIIGLYLIYYFRVFERQIGSNKYSVFVLFNLVASTFFQIVALGLLKDSQVLASGPYGFIFASFVSFYFDIPVTSRFHMFGLNLSNKSAVYFAAFQLVLSAWRRSFIPVISGLLAGFVFRANLFGICKLKFPKKLTSVFSWLFLLYPSSFPSSANIRRNAHISNIDHQVQRNNRSVGNFMPEPSESSIETLVSMGFESNAARQALLQARNDLNVATNILLEAQSG